MAVSAGLVQHLYRRAGFGASAGDLGQTGSGPKADISVSYADLVDKFVNYDPAAVDVDSHLGQPGYVNITTRGVFSPNTVINDARQRWLFRLIHSSAPLMEKMALFWHQHFATAYSKMSATYGAVDGTRLMAAKPSDDPVRQRGQIELFRQYALGNFRDLLVEVAKDPAMLTWLDGITNTKAKPQENFGRELMELFTFGVANYVESDVYAAARAFTGWNLTIANRNTTSSSYAFVFNAAQHDTAAKDFSFPIYANGSRQIPTRAAASGMQDGIDLINALAVHPETAKRIARKLWIWFVSDVEEPDAAFIENIANTYLANNTNMKPVVQAVLLSPQFMDGAHFYKRYSWPVEFVVRMLKEVGYLGFSVDNAMTPLVNMGQQLFEPPNVAGWVTGPAWFSTAGMLSRMNFASALATNQKFALREAAKPYRASPDALVGFATRQLTVPALAGDDYGTLIDYVRAGGVWTGSDAQLLNKAGGLIHLLTGSGNYQFV